MPKTHVGFFAVYIDDRGQVQRIFSNKAGAKLALLHPGRPYYIQTMARRSLSMARAIRRAARSWTIQTINFEMRFTEYWLPATARIYPDDLGPPPQLVMTIRLNRF